MRIWPTLLIFTLLFTACSRETAFEHFTKLDNRHERAVTNLQRVTLGEHNKTVALVSVIYLNPVDPTLYTKQHYFFVALYDARGESLLDYNVTLNGKNAVGIAQLDDNCSMRTLMPLNNPWNTYYQLVFKYQKDENLTLRFESGPSLQGEVTYRTDQ